MGQAAGLVRKVQIAMLASIVLYAVAGEMLPRVMPRDPLTSVPITSDPLYILFQTLSYISVSLAGATVVVRRTLVVPSEAVLKERPNDAPAVARWRTGYLFLLVLCELLGLFGIILRMVGFPLSSVWGFYLGGFLLLILYSPRVPRASSN